MADEVTIKTEEPKRPELLDSNGNPLNSLNRLDSIFSAMEQGKKLDEALQAVDKAKPAEPPPPPPPVDEKKAEVKEPVKEEVKEEAKPANLSEELDLREQLRQASEVKKEEVKDESKAEVKPDDVPPEELQVLQTDKPKTARRIQKLLDQKKELEAAVSSTKKEAEEKAAKLAELEKKLGDVRTVDPETQKKVDEQLNELAMFRRRYALENDPEVKEKYDARISSAEESIGSLLKRRSAGDAFLALVKEEGGWNKFSASNRIFTTSDGQNLTCSEAAERIMASLPLGERKQIESAMIEQLATQRDRERYFEQEQKNAQAYFKQKEEEAKKQQEAFGKQSEEVKKSISVFREKFLKETPWLQDQALPDKVTPEEKARIEDDNRYTKQLRQLFDRAVNVQSPQEALQVVTESVQYWQERRAHAKTQERVKALEAELNALKDHEKKFKQGARSVPAGGSLTGGGFKGPAAEPKSKAPQSLEEAFALIERGIPVTGKGVTLDDE